MEKGKLVVIEGADGAGTTSQTMALKELFESQSVDVVASFEPTDGPIGKLIREHLRGEHGEVDQEVMKLLFRADRLEHVTKKIMPWLDEGKLVILDRYYPSTVIYQSISPKREQRLEALRGEMQRTYQKMAFELLEPDLFIYIDTPLEVCAERRRKRGGQEEVFEKDSFQWKVSMGYREWFGRFAPKISSVCTVNGVMSKEEIRDHCANRIMWLLPWYRKPAENVYPPHDPSDPVG